jgi:thiol-disulfide isomerase/thioredoxin
MKSAWFLLLVTVMMLQISCDHAPGNNLEKLYSEYLLHQKKIDLIQYRVNRIDTFITGQIWNNTGNATIERNNRDSVFQFSFYGKRDDLDRENIYIEDKHFQIYPKKKTFRLENKYGFHVLGAPGGQMVITDILVPDTVDSDVILEDKNSVLFIITTNKTVESFHITKIVTIDKSTFLPIQVRKIVRDTILNKKSSTTFNISNILIGDQVINNEIRNIVSLSGYSEENPKIDKTADLLIGKTIPDFFLKSITREDIKLKDLQSKVVLLDFWELWCGPCLNSLPKIDEFQKKYKSSEFIVIGLTMSNTEDVNKYLSINQISFSQYQNNTDLSDFFKINSFPTYVIIDKKGLIHSIYYGYSEEIENTIKSLI